MTEVPVKRRLRWTLQETKERQEAFMRKLERHLRAAKPNLNKIMRDYIETQISLNEDIDRISLMIDGVAIDRMEPGTNIGAKLDISPIEVHPTRSFRVLPQEGWVEEHEPYYPPSDIKTCGKLPCECLQCGTEEIDITKGGKDEK